MSMYFLSSPLLLSTHSLTLYNIQVIHTLNAAGVYLVSDGETVNKTIVVQCTILWSCSSPPLSSSVYQSHTHQFILDQLSTCSPSQYRLYTTAYHYQRE